MITKVYVLFFSLALAGAVVSSASGQTPQTTPPTTPPTPTPSPVAAPTSGVATSLAALPASDVVMFVDSLRLLTDAVPRVLANDPARLAQVNAQIDQLKANTGIDARSFERIALGIRFANPAAGLTETGYVAIANSRTDTGTLVAAARLASKGKYQEQKLGGRTVYTFNLGDQLGKLSLGPFAISMPKGELAVSALSANMLALGSPASVRAAVDASAAAGRANPELIALATRNPGAIIGFGGQLPPTLAERLDIGSDEISRSIASIRQLYGSIGTTAKGFEMLTVLRTGDASEARLLSDNLGAVKQFAPLLVGQLPAGSAQLARSALDTLKVTTQGAETQIRFEVPQTDVATLVRGN